MLSCFCQFGELSRMTQFKDKSAKHPEDINSGLFTYPVLMAADILLYQADLVPVGIDQKQHLELARNVAQRFNSVYGNPFTLPAGYIPKLAAKVMSLQEPTKKMSKSDENPKASIAILDKPETIIKKFKSAVTDSEALVAYREGKDGINNLMAIYSAVTGKGFEELEQEFSGKGYGDFKVAVGEAVVEELRPVRERFDELMKNRDYLETCIGMALQRLKPFHNARWIRYTKRSVPCKIIKNAGFKRAGIFDAAAHHIQNSSRTMKGDIRNPVTSPASAAGTLWRVFLMPPAP